MTQNEDRPKQDSGLTALKPDADDAEAERRFETEEKKDPGKNSVIQNNNVSSPETAVPVSRKIYSMIKKLAKRWFIDAFSGMAQGLFCTLIAGTIMAQISGWILLSDTAAGQRVGNFVGAVADIAKALTGAGIGVGIAHALKANRLVMFSAAFAGYAGAFSDAVITGTFAAGFAPGNPVGAYIVSLIAVELGMLTAGRTRVDIVVVPLGMMLVTMLSLFAAYPFILLINLIAKGIALATGIAPVSMGIIIAVSMGIFLTLPTSSAAIWLVIAGGAMATDPNMLLAGGAAVAGCAAHMVGFAVQSFRENGFGGLIAQGIGTSMLQIPNLMRHPIIIVPPVVASAVVGPLSTAVFKLRCNAAGGGMGTSGLVGVFGVIDASAGVVPDWEIALGIILLMFVIPAAICLGLSEVMRKKGWIRSDYLKLEL